MLMTFASKQLLFPSLKSKNWSLSYVRAIWNLFYTFLYTISFVVENYTKRQKMNLIKFQDSFSVSRIIQKPKRVRYKNKVFGNQVDRGK